MNNINKKKSPPSRSQWLQQRKKRLQNKMHPKPRTPNQKRGDRKRGQKMKAIARNSSYQSKRKRTFALRKRAGWYKGLRKKRNG